MLYTIESYVGVGPITFGMSRRDVRGVLGGPVQDSARTDTGIPTDFFSAEGIFVYYSKPGLVEAVEFAGPSSPTFRSRDFLGHPYRMIEDWIRTFDPHIVLDPAGLTSYEFGFGVYAPSARKEPDLPVMGVIVFERGYYDRRLNPDVAGG